MPDINQPIKPQEPIKNKYILKTAKKNGDNGLYDWDLVKIDYWLDEDNLSVTAFLEKIGLPANPNSYRITKGWKELRKADRISERNKQLLKLRNQGDKAFRKYKGDLFELLGTFTPLLSGYLNRKRELTPTEYQQLSNLALTILGVPTSVTKNVDTEELSEEELEEAIFGDVGETDETPDN